MSPFSVMCAEHNVQLNEDGTCPQCRDSNGQPFILDMQGTYLEPEHPAEAAIRVFCEEYVENRCKEFRR
jgi:hypothetical protein